MAKKIDNLRSRIAEAEKYYPDFVYGLSNEQIEARKKVRLVNKTPKKVTKTYWRIFTDNIFTFFNLIYFGMAIAMAFSLKLTLSSFFFLLPVTCNVIIGLISDIRARRLVDKLRLITNPKARVVREGKEEDIDVRDLVLSDIVILKTGDQVSADSIVVNGRLFMDESLVTGESIKIEKRVGDEILSGTFVQSGKAYVRVTQVGIANYAESLQNNAKQFSRPKSELKSSCLLIFWTTGLIAIILGLAQTLLWLGQHSWQVTHQNYSDFIGGLSGSMVSMIPAGLYLLTSLTLTVGVLYLASKRMNVQELYCIEMLARVDTVCFDKTGTLTDGKLSVSHIYGYSTFTDEDIKNALVSIVKATGDDNPTAKAILELKNKEIYEPAFSIPFDSEKKWSAASFAKEGTFIFGAPSFVEAKISPFASNRIEELSSRGYRVLALFHSKKILKNDILPANPTLISLIAISDHIKDDAKANIEWFQSNGVQIKVISGDNPVTVSEIASMCGVKGAAHFISMQDVKDEDIPELVKNFTVFGRVSPEQKRLLVSALQEEGHKVAMTGDGVNDILALKKADCSIAMASGSPAARNASHIVSLDNDFSKLPDVVGEGRRVINNLQRTASLFLAKNIFAILMTISFLVASCFGGGSYPFTTSNMLLWELFTIGIGGFFLALQPSKERLKGHFMSFIVRHALPSGAMEFLSALILFIVSWSNPSFLSFSSATTLSVIIFSLLSYLTFFAVSWPFDKYRTIVNVAIVLFGIIFVAVDYFSPLKPWHIIYEGITLNNLLVALAIFLLLGGMYIGWTFLVDKKKDKKNDDKI